MSRRSDVALAEYVDAVLRTAPLDILCERIATQLGERNDLRAAHMQPMLRKLNDVTERLTDYDRDFDDDRLNRL